jgi:predicted 2-oxoglutarate/Fe(II)-dependent dioxygenase YbiX
MIAPEVTAIFNLYQVKDFLDARTCGEIIAELCRSPEMPATTYGRSESGVVDVTTRKVARVNPSQVTIERVSKLLSEQREEVGVHFGLPLGDIETPQFLRYQVGDFFVAHQDGNTGMLRLDREMSRKISVIIFLNGQSETPEADTYDGGSLVFSEWRPGRKRGELRLSGETGMLVAFPSDLTHEVQAVTRGERYSIVSWYG